MANMQLTYDSKVLEIKQRKETDQEKRSILSRKEYKEFINKNNFSESEVIMFSKSIKMYSGVVVGRLQHYKYVGFDQLTNSKAKYYFFI